MVTFTEEILNGKLHFLCIYIVCQTSKPLDIQPRLTLRALHDIGITNCYTVIKFTKTVLLFLISIFHHFIKKLEAAVQRCSVKKVFLKILQNSQESICARLFIKKEQLY